MHIMNHGGNPEKTFLAIVTFTVGMTLFILYVCLLSGCSTGAKELAIARPSQAVLIKDVPFFPQLDYQCGPASLAGVLNYYHSIAGHGSLCQAERIRFQMVRR
jgi:hypothetical protein